MKIGQEITVKEDFEIKCIISENVITVKEGDKGFLDSKGHLHITTGAGKGKIFEINEVEKKGYDHMNISRMIYNRLNSWYCLERFLDEEEIELDRFLEEIEDVLTDIL